MKKYEIITYLFYWSGFKKIVYHIASRLKFELNYQPIIGINSQYSTVENKKILKSIELN